MNDYPMLRFIERYGTWLPVVTAAAFPAAAIITVAQGGSLWWLVAGAAAAVFCYGAVRSYVELIRVMTDMLLPK